mmetsp:Transcript_12041/g.34406  ORF Transcript_12041/g.34406 Transcript_12041/m.34406 type:complete len:435 (+) Transcript_12041:79-1383(+)
MRLVSAAALAGSLSVSGRALVLRRDSEAAAHNNSVAVAKTYRQELHNFQNVQYFGDFKIGDQVISGIFDTGSFELLVRSTRCDHCAHPTAPYDRTKSDTYTKNGTVAKHVYGSGPCISMQGYETVTVGPMVSEGQSFWEIIRHEIHALDSAKFAAIVGIGPNFAYGNTDKTLLMSFGVTEFSVCLQRGAGASGYLTWGPTASAEHRDAHFAKARVLGKHHWVTSMHDVSFGPLTQAMKPFVPCTGKGCAVIIDSGTSLIAAPGLALQQLSKQIEPIMEDCSNLHKLPTLRFTIDGTEFTLPPKAYVMRITGAVMEADSVWDILFFKPKLRKLNMCMPAFMQIDMMSQNGPVWIMGMPFFRYYHTTFDRTAKEMHFARASPDCSPQPFRVDGEEKTQLLATDSDLDDGPMDMDPKAMVPPSLSSLIDTSASIVDL